MQEIKTSVDSLVDLVKQKHSVSIEDASSSLGIPSVVLNEWAEYLEQEKVIEIKYKGTIPFLTENSQKTVIGEVSQYAKEAKEDLERIKEFESAINKAETDKRNINRLEFVKKVKMQYIVLTQNIQDFVNENRNDDLGLEMFKKIKARLLIFERNIAQL